MSAPTILLTGSTGYIASHTWLALWQAGFDVIGVDNFVNSSRRVLDRLERVGGRRPVFVEASVGDAPAMSRVFDRHRIDGVIHFAALKSVGDSVREPLAYYRNNIDGLLTVCELMRAHDCRRFVFSSSATVYGDPSTLPIAEDTPLTATNPYGQTKLMGEQILNDLERADAGWQTACLRYFNPVGAHASGLIGEDPRGTPANLMPFVAQVAVGRRAAVSVFGNDYPTPDGTGVRDYIHVCDLAEGHVAALRRLLDHPGSFSVNLGTGRGYSVLELIAAFSRACGREVPWVLAPRRPGDVAACWADPSRAASLLGWRAALDLDRMCADTWRWQTLNPQGFDA